jgi:LPS O-antigen subunit length determinant protein (WzzB/FepE family)
MPHLEILDMPREAGRRIKPRRAMICIVSTLMAGFFAIFLAICKETIFSQAERIKELKDTLHDS